MATGWPLTAAVPKITEARMEEAGSLLKRLPLLDRAELREQWSLHFHVEAGNNLNSKLLRLAIAHRIQELEQNATARCDAIRKRAREYLLSNEDIGIGRARFLRPGTRLLREYKGVVHEVLAIENGRFVYAGQIFNSLTRVAIKIAGPGRSGAVFFGLKGRPWGGFND